MTDVGIAEQAIATLHEKLHTATKRANEIALDRQRLSYAAFVDGDPSARVELDKLNAIAIADRIENIKAAIAEANKRLTQARDNVQREAAKQHFKKLHEALDALQEMAGPLDQCLGQMVPGQMGGKRYQPGLANPPLLLATGDKLASLVQELTALALDRGVRWLPGGWDRAHVADFRIELEKMTEAYCGRLPPPSARNFSGLITALVASIKKATLAQQEQTNTEVAA